MAKSNCPAEDSASPQASAGQLTPCFLPLSLSGRLLQVTVAISPPAAKGASKGRFSAYIRSEGPRSQMQDFERWARGELRRRKGNLYQVEGPADFRDPASWASLVIEFCQLGGIYRLPEKFPSRCVFKRCICRGTFRLEQNQKTAKRLFRNIFQRGDMGG